MSENSQLLETLLSDNNIYHYDRPRICALLYRALKYPIISVCAGSGYGKTRAVYSKIRKIDYNKLFWLQFSELDNIPSRFWESYVYASIRIDKQFSEALKKIGFPDTSEKYQEYIMLYRTLQSVKRVIVLDDLHVIKNREVLRFLDNAIADTIPYVTVIIISSAEPEINTMKYLSKGFMFTINEDDLRFTREEIIAYFNQINLRISAQDADAIYSDTEGWAFAVNMIAMSLHKMPGQTSYARTAMKQNIYRFIESDVFSAFSERLKRFLIRLSLIDRLAADLVELLCGDEALMKEFKNHYGYIRYDMYTNTYLIHNLFLAFLHERQYILTNDERNETNAIAGDWCAGNDLNIDAISYYEKIEAYDKIVTIISKMPPQFPADKAQFFKEIFERAPDGIFDAVELSAVMHIRAVRCSGNVEEAARLIKKYEEKYLAIPESDFKNNMLGGIYYGWGLVRSLMCTVDDRYDFDVYYAKQYECYMKTSNRNELFTCHPVGPWISLVGSSMKSAPDEYAEAVERTEMHISQHLNGMMSGEGSAARGELLFYKNEIKKAAGYFEDSLKKARTFRQYEVINRVMIYLIRIAYISGEYIKFKNTFEEMKPQLDERDYWARYTTYDIAAGWYYYSLKQPENIPEWLRGSFSPYGNAYFIENFSNQLKARYCYLTGNYNALFAYITEMRENKPALFGNLEMRALEACAYYKLKDKDKAYRALREAWELAVPNDLLMPFIEPGKDMRTLTSAAIRDGYGAIPRDWLETVNRKASAFAKHQAQIIKEHLKPGSRNTPYILSARECQVLTGLYHGLTRTEIAASYSLSLNTVKMIIRSLYTKLGAENVADAVRIAAELKLVSDV